MGVKAKRAVRAFGLATVSCLALSLDVSTQLYAQSAPTTLPPVTVDAPQQQTARRPQRARSAAASRSNRPASARAGNQPAQSIPASRGAGPTTETAWGHVDGYVAT